MPAITPYADINPGIHSRTAFTSNDGAIAPGGLRGSIAKPPTPVDQGLRLSDRSTSLDDVSRNYGYSPETIPYNPKKPDETLAAITRREQDRFDAFYRPIQQEVISSLQDTSIIEAARGEASRSMGDSSDRGLRNLRRYGLSQNPLQAQQAQRSAQLADTLSFDTTVNDARIEQKERNDGLRRQLIDIGRGVAQSATGGLTQAADAKAQRDSANKSAKSAERSQNINLAASAAVAALMFL